MRIDINKMKDYYEVLDFVSQTAPQIGAARNHQRQGMDMESFLPGIAQGGGFSSHNPTSGGGRGHDPDELGGYSGIASGGVNIAFVAGTIRGGEQERMNRMIFRVTRGKALTFFKEFKQDDQARCVYMVVY